MKLRQKTGLGMGACKDALVEANGDFDAAEKLLRERMKDKMDGRTDRPAGEGCLAIAAGHGKIAIVEIRSETDFTAKNAEFRAMAADVAAMAPEKPVYSNGYKGAVLGMLLAAYTFNFIDRTIISTIGQAIKVDLSLTDTQLGLLGGLYFALLYTLLGIPIARLAERKNRVTIITVGLVIWSGFTALCGFAQSFVQLALMRFGVGIGEAACSPPAHSLISDYFEPKQRATALSIYSFGIPLGTMFGAVAGGWLAQEFMPRGDPAAALEAAVRTCG
jgi:dipeptide/tripeptide permease